MERRLAAGFGGPSKENGGHQSNPCTTSCPSVPPIKSRSSRREGVLPKSRSVPVLGHSNVETNAIAGFFMCPTDGMHAVFSAFVFGQHARDEAQIKGNLPFSNACPRLWASDLGPWTLLFRPRPGAGAGANSKTGVGTARPHRLFDNIKNAGRSRPVFRAFLNRPKACTQPHIFLLVPASSPARSPRWPAADFALHFLGRGAVFLGQQSEQPNGPYDTHQDTVWLWSALCV